MDFTDNVKTQKRLGDNQEVIGGGSSSVSDWESNKPKVPSVCSGEKSVKLKHTKSGKEKEHQIDKNS